MVDIAQTVEGEKKHLPLHVDMCVLRYRQIMRMLYALVVLVVAVRATQPDALSVALSFIGLKP